MTEVITKNEIIEKVQKEANDEKKWCVYCHTNKINNKKYFGITSKPVKERWKNGNGYCDQIVFWRAICKYTWDGFIHEIIADNLTEEEAKEKEIGLIALYKTNCSRYKNPTFGYNMTDGGDGTKGHNPYANKTEEEMRLISEKKSKSLSGQNNGMYGRYGPLNPAYGVRRFGQDNPNYGNHKLAGANNPMYGRPVSDETREKQRQAKLGKKASEATKRKQSEKRKGYNNGRANAVYCIELDEIFWGQHGASEKYGINRCCIGDCCRGKQKTAGKHPATEEPLSWKYVYDQEQKSGTIIYGAISLGYITEEQVDRYFNNLKQKGNN